MVPTSSPKRFPQQTLHTFKKTSSRIMISTKQKSHHLSNLSSPKLFSSNYFALHYSTPQKNPIISTSPHQKKLSPPESSYQRAILFAARHSRTVAGVPRACRCARVARHVSPSQGVMGRSRCEAVVDPPGSEHIPPFGKGKLTYFLPIKHCLKMMFLGSMFVVFC